MAKWRFLELTRDETVPLTNSKIQPKLELALLCAGQSRVPNPKFSSYYVKCACLLLDRNDNDKPVYKIVRNVLGGNLEYGLCQALHGEELLVSALISKRGISRVDWRRCRLLVAFSSRFETGRVPTCCGNCRDIMRDYFPPDTLIFGGHPKGGKVMVAHLRDFLVNNYPAGHLPPYFDMERTEQMLLECLLLENNIYFSGQPHPERRYVAIIQGSKTYLGAHDVMCDYHPIYAIRDAVRQARRDNNPGFSEVFVASEGQVPDVMYKDRQHLLELNFQQECLYERTFDPPVYLLTYKLVSRGRPRVTSIRATTVKKWLPFPFSPANFGDKFVAYAKREFTKKLC